MYTPKYSITTGILKDIGLIEAAKEVVTNAPLIPAYETKFRDDARLKRVHFGTALEGNDLTSGEAKLIVDKEVQDVAGAGDLGIVARARDVQEVINYRNVVHFIENIGEVDEYTTGLINQVHAQVVERLVPADQCGKVRKTAVVLRNSATGEIAFRPPEASQVPGMIAEFLAWLNSDKGRQEHAVIRAGITHYALTAIHPYTEGNGRTARAMATLLLFAEGYDIKRFFALEEYFDSHAAEYFGALNEVSSQNEDWLERDLTNWLEVFTRALALELTRIKERVKELTMGSALKTRAGKQVILSERQLKIVDYLNTNGEMGMADARQLLYMVSEDTILRDFRYLLNKKVVSKRGSTKAARYVLTKYA